MTISEQSSGRKDSVKISCDEFLEVPYNSNPRTDRLQVYLLPLGFTSRFPFLILHFALCILHSIKRNGSADGLQLLGEGGGKGLGGGAAEGQGGLGAGLGLGEAAAEA